MYLSKSLIKFYEVICIFVVKFDNLFDLIFNLKMMFLYLNLFIRFSLKLID